MTSHFGSGAYEIWVALAGRSHPCRQRESAAGIGTTLAIFCREQRELVEPAQNLLAAQIGHFEQYPRDTRIAIRCKRLRIGRGIEHRDRQGIPPGRARCLAQPFSRAFGLPARARAREPAIAEFDHAAHGMVALAAQQDRRMWLLLRLGVEPDRIEIDEFAVKFGLLLRPQRLARARAAAQLLETSLVADAVILHFLGIPASADAENEPAPG